MSASIKTLAFRPDLVLGVELTAIRRMLGTHAPALSAPVRAGFYHLIWVQRGHALHTVDFQRVALAPGSLLFVGLGRVHTFDLTADYDGQVLLFTDAFFARSEEDARFLHTTSLFQEVREVPVVLAGAEAPDFTALFTQVATELRHAPDPYQPVVLQNLVHNLLLVAERTRQQQGYRPLDQGPDSRYTLRFRDLVEQQFRTIRTVHWYAAQLSVSEKRLAQATANTLGKLPKELLDERVILEAKRLLVHTRATSKEVGFVLGFAEPTNFSKYFRRQTSWTPSEFRALHVA